MDILKKIFPKVPNALVLFIIILITGYSDRLLPPRVIDFLDTNRIAQVVVTYLLILFSDDKMDDISRAFKRSFVIFIVYIIVSKQSIEFFCATVLLLLIIYFINKQKDIYKKKGQEKSAKQLDVTEKILYSIVTLVVIIGFSSYFMKQYSAHGSKSSNILMFMIKFLLVGRETDYKNLLF